MTYLRDVRGMPRYYLAATLARMGDQMVAFTLVLLVLERTDRPGLAGVTGAAYALPAVLTGPFLGTWLDRTRHRRAALTLNQATVGAVMAGMLVVVGHGPDWITPALAAVAGATLPMVSGGFTSMLPSLVPPALLTRANSVEATSFGAAAIAGPAAAATIAAAVSPEAAVGIIIVTAAGSIVALLRLPATPPVTSSGQAPFLAAVREGLVQLLRTPPLRASTVASTVSMGVGGLLLIALPLHMRTVGVPAAASGYIWTAVEVGSVVTALLMGRWQHRWRPERTVIVSVAAAGLATLVWPLAPGLTLLLTFALVTGLLEGPMLPAMFGARQRYSPLELQGRVSTTGASLRIGAMAVGQVAGGLLVPALGTHAVLVMVGCGYLAGAAFGWLAGLSRRQPTGGRRPGLPAATGPGQHDGGTVPLSRSVLPGECADG